LSRKKYRGEPIGLFLLIKRDIIESLDIPDGISCSITGKKLICKKGDLEVSRAMDIQNIILETRDSKLFLSCKKGSKKEFKVIKTFIAHARNMFRGLNKKFVYKLEACNLHFPMTLKVEKDVLLVNNFLGEKTPRSAKIAQGVEVNLSGTKITLTSSNKESAGQTATNIEKATKIKNRDRRVFQDGIFITSRPGREI